MEKLIDEFRDFYCDKCDRGGMILTFAETGDQKILHSIKNYGQCKVTKNAEGEPTREQLKSCPVASYIFANRESL